MDHRNFYGRIKGKSLNAAQVRYLEEDLPKLSVAGITFEENPERDLLISGSLLVAEKFGWRLVLAVASIWFTRRCRTLMYSF